MACKTFHKGKYYVTFKRGFEDSVRDITVVIERVFENDCLRISLSDDEDPLFLCVMCITRADYEDLKKQQGLLVDFDNFPSQLVKLLQQCVAKNMFLMMQQTNPIQFYFEVVEHNEFKRLVHLSLKTGPATDVDVKQNMANTICSLKKTISALKSSSQGTEITWSDKCASLERKVSDLTHTVSRMEEAKIRYEAEFQDTLKQERDRLTQERIQWQKNMDMNTKAQLATYQDNINVRDKQIEELHGVCKQLRENIMQLENQLCEKNQRLNVLEKEVQKSHIETATLKAKNTSLEREVAEKDKLYSQLNSRCTILDKATKENIDSINELKCSIQGLKKEKSSLEERLALSESLVNKNNEAIHSTSEQLLKANQIISKQNADLIEMKEKLLCRTAIALEQEKVIERNAKEMEELKSQLFNTKQDLDKVREELDNLKEKYENSEKALKDRDETIKNNNMVIQWLHKKMEDNSPPEDMRHEGIQKSSSSTPYFLAKNQSRSSHGVSDDTIDFYATSKLSSVDDSPVPQRQQNEKTGLDPKYLKPASSDVHNIKVSKMKSADFQSQKGKENIHKELPKVDYREKKTGRSTYRATPVSAYFP